MIRNFSSNNGWRPVTALFALMLGIVAPVKAVDFQLGSATNAAGQTVGISLNLANVPTNFSACAIFITNSPALGTPTLNMPVNPNNILQAFIDPVAPGIFRLTCLLFYGTPPANGTLLELNYHVPANTPAGIYPISFTPQAVSPAPGGPNFETRTVVTSALIEGTGTGGEITVRSSAPVITGISQPTNNVVQLDFSGLPGVDYVVQGSTNLPSWENITNLTANSQGYFQLLHSSTNPAARYFRVIVP
jgi:hypothetical protein